MSIPFVKLGTVCEVNPRLPKDSDELQSVSFLPMSSVSEKGKILEQEIRVLAETKQGFTYFERGDVLLAKITPCFENGKAVFTSELKTLIGYGSTEFHVLRPTQGITTGKYLFYLIWNDSFRFQGQLAMKGAAGQKRVSADFLRNFKIPLPPLAEQQKIATILDAADSLRQKNRELIDHYTALSKALFLDMFGDLISFPSKLLCHVSKFIDYRGKTPTKTANGIPLLTAKNVKTGHVSQEPREFISRNGYIEWMTRGFPKEGDVLFTTEAPMGQAALLPKYEEVAIAQRIICIQTNSELNPHFLLYVIFSEYFKKQLSNRATGSTVKGVRSKELAKIEIPIPSITLQNQFAERIQLIEQQKQQAQASLEHSEALFNSLLQRAFTGELTAKRAA